MIATHNQQRRQQLGQDLPPGFVIDQPVADNDGYAELPAGFTIDKPGSGGGGVKTGETVRKAATQDATLDSLAQQIDRVQTLHNEGFRNPGLLEKLGEYNPWSDTNSTFNAAGAALSDAALAAFKVPGSGAQTEGDAARLAKAVQPSNTDFDGEVAEKLASVRRRVDAQRAALGLEPWKWSGLDAGTPQPGIGGATGPTPPAAPPAAPAGEIQFKDQAPEISANSYRFTPEQEQQISAAAQAGASAGDLIALAQRLGGNLPPENASAIAEFYAQEKNRGVAPSFDYREVDRIKPVDPGDGRLGAAARGAGDTLTVGFLDEAGALADVVRDGGTYADALDRRRGMAAFDDQEHGGWRLGGQLVGGLALPGFGAKSVGQMAKLGAAYGGAYGLGSADGDMGDRAIGAATGAVTGGAAGAGGGLIAAGIGSKLAQRAARPDPALDLIGAAERQGVPLTVADVSPRSRAMFSAIETTPIAGAIERSALRRGDEALERRVAEIGGDQVTDRQGVGDAVRQAGERYIDRSREKVSRAYGIAESRSAGQQIVPSKTLAMLDQHIAELSQAPGVNGSTIELLQKMRGDLIDVASGGARAMDVATLRGVGTGMRGQVNAGNLRHSDTERRVLAAIQAADEDIGDQLTGSAKSAFDRAGAMHSARASTIDNVVRQFIGGRGTKALSSEKVAGRLERAANPASGDGRALRKMMEMAGPDERAEIASTIADQLGRRGTDGDNSFSASRLFTEINKYSDDAREAIWGKDGSRHLADLARIAEKRGQVNDRLNNSRTAPGVNWQSAIMAAIGGGTGFAAGGDIASTALGAGISIGVNAVGAKVLSSPASVRAIALAARAKTPQAQATALRRLGAVMAKEPALAAELDPIRGALEKASKDDAKEERLARRDMAGRWRGPNPEP